VTTNRRVFTTLLFAIALGCCALPSNASAEWKVIEYQKRDYITVQSISDFYGFKREDSGKHVWLRENRIVVKATVGSQDLLINNIKFILSYPVIEVGGRRVISRLDLCKLIDPVIRPRLIRNANPFKTVILDPGHGGADTGAKSVHGYEKDFALKLSKQLKTKLEAQGFKVILSRSGDQTMELTERVAFANSIPDAIFISIHFNYGSSSASGIETFALTPSGAGSTIAGPGSADYKTFSGNRRDSENIALATAVHASVMQNLKDLRVVDRGIKRARWAVLKGINKPAILFEGGFLTNKEESRRINDPAHRDRIATAIASAVTNFRKALTSTR